MLVLVGISFSLLVLWLLRPERVGPRPNEPQQPTAESIQTQPARQPKAREPSAAVGEEKPSLAKEFESIPATLSLQERLEELARRRGVSLNVITQEMLMQASNMVQEVSQTVNRPIEFYGKVVDESGTPLQRASVTADCLVYPEDHLTTNILTDTRGLFSLNNLTGATLFVQVSKEGYEEVKGTNQNKFDYYSLPGFEPSRPDPNSPVTFHLRKNGE